MKKTLAIFFILGVSFLFGQNALALRQLVQDTTMDTDASYVGPVFTQSFIAPVSGYPISIQIPMLLLSGTAPNSINITLNQEGINNGWGLATKIPLSTSPANINTQIGYWTTSSQPWSMIAGQKYIMTIPAYYNAAPDRYIKFYGAGSSVYSGGLYGTSTQGWIEASSSNYAIKDIAFILTMGDASGNPYDEIYFDTMPSSTCDFSYWPTTANYSASTQQALENNEYSVGVLSGNIAYGLFIQDALSGFAYDSGLDIRKTTALPPSSQNQHVYQAQAYICSSANNADCETGSANFIATSDVWEFIINDNVGNCATSSDNIMRQLLPNGYYVETLSSSTPTMPDVNCEFYCDNGLGITDTLICQIKEGFCNATRFLFYPNQSILDNFGNLKSQVENKPPFGYISTYTETFESFSSATSTTSTLSTSGVDTDQLTILTNLSVFDIIQDIIADLFWFLFGFYIYRRAKHFSLHG